MADALTDAFAEFHRRLSAANDRADQAVRDLARARLGQQMPPRRMFRALDPTDAYQRRYGDPAPALAQDGRRAGHRRAHGFSRPNAGVAAIYQRSIDGLVRAMCRDVTEGLRRAYVVAQPVMQEASNVADGGEHISRGGSGGTDLGAADDAGALAFDRSPADWLKSAFDAVARRWRQQFDDAAPRIAAWFSQAALERSDAALHRLLRAGGLSVRLQMSPAMRDVLDGTVHENVALIRSIPEQYLTQVEGAVMRSVTAGRDLHQLTEDLVEQTGVTRRRAAAISHDQNNKATSAMTRARQVELGLQSVWMHSHAGKHPRPTHLSNNGQPYDPAEGWYDPAVGRNIWPGELINCRCFAKSIVPGFE